MEEHPGCQKFTLTIIYISNFEIIPHLQPDPLHSDTPGKNKGR